MARALAVVVALGLVASAAAGAVELDGSNFDDLA